MIALVEGASRQKTPNEIALSILLAGLTIVFLIATVTLRPFALYAGGAASTAGAHRAPRLPDPDDDRRPALGHRHRRHGPRAPAQRPRDVRPRRRGGGRRQRPAPRQDRHDHARQPPGDRLLPGAGRPSGRPRRGGAALVALGRDARGPLHRRPRQGEVQPARAAGRRHEVHPLLGADADVRRGLQRPPDPQGRRRLGGRVGPRPGRHDRPRRLGPPEQDLGRGRHAAARRRRRRGSSASSPCATSSRPA